MLTLVGGRPMIQKSHYHIEELNTLLDATTMRLSDHIYALLVLREHGDSTDYRKLLSNQENFKKWAAQSTFLVRLIRAYDIASAMGNDKAKQVFNKRLYDRYGPIEFGNEIFFFDIEKVLKAIDSIKTQKTKILDPYKTWLSTDFEFYFNRSSSKSLNIELLQTIAPYLIVVIEIIRLFLEYGYFV